MKEKTAGIKVQLSKLLENNTTRDPELLKIDLALINNAKNFIEKSNSDHLSLTLNTILEQIIFTRNYPRLCLKIDVYIYTNDVIMTGVLNAIIAELKKAGLILLGNPLAINVKTKNEDIADVVFINETTILYLEINSWYKGNKMNKLIETLKRKYKELVK
eukprot:GAHX01001972.1.p1 GENE.GAHX01001972.1~~GAHX01001972.1.p1  ORF type:complete len:160 (-),score=37.08 GAHX01001972.1:6-485(-)